MLQPNYRCSILLPAAEKEQRKGNQSEPPPFYTCLKQNGEQAKGELPRKPHPVVLGE